MRDLASRRLARDGHAVTTCAEGAAALDLAAGGGFDLMLLDLMMPGLSGLDVLAALRASAATRALPVVVMSALDETEAAVRCIEAGADDFLTKPLNETLLRARIGSSLERKFLRDREQAATERLREEQARADALLRNVLPEAVVARLAAGETVIADHLPEVTVLFCDLVGFTALSAGLDAPATLDLLNAIFSAFDALAEANGLEKIKTIGDAYMVVGGLAPARDGDAADHAERVARMACGMAEAAARAAPEAGLRVRVGVDTGPAAAGIIGRRKFFYDVWGDTVNTASRLEALGEPGRVHVSEATRRALGADFHCEPRAPIHVKGKGVMRTFFVAPATPSRPKGEPADNPVPPRRA
jgi:adenylate cyclase